MFIPPVCGREKDFFFEVPISLKILEKILKAIAKNSAAVKEVPLILGLQLLLGKYNHSVQKNNVQIFLPLKSITFLR